MKLTKVYASKQHENAVELFVCFEILLRYHTSGRSRAANILHVPLCSSCSTVALDIATEFSAAVREFLRFYHHT